MRLPRPPDFRLRVPQLPAPLPRDHNAHYHRRLLRQLPAHFAFEAVRPPANAAAGVLLALRGRAGKPHEAGLPVRDAAGSLPDIRAAARDLTSGAQVRARLFWRYTLLWRRPASPATPGPTPSPAKDASAI